MRRMLPALILGLLLAPVVAQTTAQTATQLKGTYEIVNFPATGQGAVFGLIQLTPKGNTVEGEWVAAAPNQRGLTLQEVVLDGNTLRITLRRANANLVFEGRVLPGEGETIRGSFVIDGRATAAQVASTDKTELTAENATAPATELTPLRQTLTQLRQAGRNKAEVDQVRGWATDMLKVAQPYGPRYESEVVTQIAEALAPQRDYAALAEDYARRAEKVLTDKDAPEYRLRVLDALATALKSAGKTAEAATMEARADKAYRATVPPFKPTPYEGRRSQSDRVVVMELFTGAQCPPCVAADVGFDALEQTYKPTEVALLQFHVHIPGPDPMTNATTEGRQRYYGVRSAPSTFFNGRSQAGGGGGMAASENKYRQYRGIIDKLLEEPAGAAVNLDAHRQGDTITFKANVSKLAEPGEDKKLRFVLAEEEVRFVGGNRIRLHHMVVRAMPGGVDGMALSETDSQHTASVNLRDLRQELTKYLDDFAARRAFPQPERPLALEHFKAIALVQDDATKEILQAAVVDVGGAGQ